MGCALLIVSPFFKLGNASGHDFAFHAASWMEAARQWGDGIYFPRWAAGANFGFGEPRFIFYPPLSWILGAALSIVAPWSRVPTLFIVVTQTMAGLSAFALGRRLLPERGAILCAVFYAANPYALLIIYMRSDFAEELAMAFFPVLILTAMEMSGILRQRAATNRIVALFAICFAAVWLSNAPAGVMASYSAAVMIAWAAFTKKSWTVVARGAAGLALGFGLAAFYLIPAVHEQSWVNIAQALSSGLQPSQNFLYTEIADPEHNLFNWIASSVAILMMVTAGLFAVAEHRALRGEGKNRKVAPIWGGMLLLAAMASVLMLRVSSFLWVLLPKLRFVQFPWRWMGILAVPCAYFVAATAARRRASSIWSVTIACLAAAVFAGSGAWMVQNAWWDFEDLPVLRAALESDQGFEGTDEYDPAGDDHSSLPQKAPRVRLLKATRDDALRPPARVHVERWTAEEKELRISSREALRAELRLLDYPAWQVFVNDARVTPEHGEETRQMVLPLAAGSSHVVARLVRTMDRTVGAAVSLASLLAVFVLFVWPKPKPKLEVSAGLPWDGERPGPERYK